MVSHTIHTETHSTPVSWIRASVRSQDGVEILLAKVRIDPSIHCHTVPLRAFPTPPASDWLTDFTPQQLICACHLYTVRGSVAWCLCHYSQKRTKMTQTSQPKPWVPRFSSNRSAFSKQHTFVSFLFAITNKYHLFSSERTHKATALWKSTPGSGL